MMPPRYFIRNEEDYRALESDAATIFRLEERLPAQVFRETMGIFRFLDIVKFAQPEFWTMLLELATLFGDQEIRILLQEPSAFEYKEWMAVFGALRFPFSTTSQEYCDTFRYDSCDGKQLPALYYSVNTFCLYGSSQRWGIYGHRDLDLAIGAIRLSDQMKNEWSQLSGPLWRGKQDARDSVNTNAHFRKDSISYTETLFASYDLITQSPPG
jgi:hypothetical protein